MQKSVLLANTGHECFHFAYYVDSEEREVRGLHGEIAGALMAARGLATIEIGLN